MTEMFEHFPLLTFFLTNRVHANFKKHSEFIDVTINHLLIHQWIPCNYVTDIKYCTTNWFTVWRQEKAYKTKVFLKRFPTIINNFDRMAEWISHWLCSQAIACSNPTKGYFFFLNFQNWLYYKIFSSLAPQGLTYFWPT